MSYNDIAYSFSQFPNKNPKDCKHLKELFNQALVQLNEEYETPIVIKTKKKLKHQK